MCGSAFCMTSPSISSTRRNTPCAAGCCGPKFMVRLRISATRASLGVGRRRIAHQFGRVAIIVADDARCQGAILDGHRFVNDPLQLRVVADLDISDQRKVLTERIANKSVVGQQAAKIWVIAKQDPVEVKSLALKPVGARPYGGDR